MDQALREVQRQGREERWIDGALAGQTHYGARATRRKPANAARVLPGVFAHIDSLDPWGAATGSENDTLWPSTRTNSQPPGSHALLRRDQLGAL